MSVKIIIIESDNMPTALDALRAALADPKLADSVPQAPRTSVIIEEVCGAFQVESHQLQGPSRQENVALPRHVAFYLFRQWTKLSLQQIGMHFNRDHTSVMHGISRIRKLPLADPDFATKLAAIEDALAKRGLIPEGR